MGRRKQKHTKGPNAAKSVEIEKLTIGALLAGANRLTLGSACFAVGLLTALGGGAFAVGEWRGRAALETQAKTLEDQVTQIGQERDQARTEATRLTAERDAAIDNLNRNMADDEKFSTDFATRLMDPQVIEALRRSVAADAPDGFDDQQWLLASLVWQLKSQNGFAEFLAGATAHRVELTFDQDGEVGFQWDEGQSAVAVILAQVPGEYSPETLTKVNESINRFGFFPLKPDQIIVRGVDGGILLTSPGY